MPDERAGHKTEDSRPAPLTPAACDLRGLDFMPLHLQQLWESDFDALASDREFRIGLKLWGKSWSEVPAASLPLGEVLLAKKAGVTLEEWRAVAKMALHGWIECSDGRLYHKVVARVALKAWIERIAHRKRSAAGNAAKAKQSFDEAPFVAQKLEAEAFLRALDPQTPDSLMEPEQLLEGDETEPSRSPSRPEKTSEGTVKGRDSEGKGQEGITNPSGSKKDSFLIDDGWALDTAALEDASVSGLTQAEIEAAASEHLEFWRGNGARKSREGWVRQWRSRIDDIAEDPEKRRKLTRGRVKAKGPTYAPAPVTGPRWWQEAGAKLHAANPAIWTATFAGCKPGKERGSLAAPSEPAAQRINTNTTGIDVEAVLGFALIATDPEEARIRELERTDPDRGRIARAARDGDGAAAP